MGSERLTLRLTASKIIALELEWDVEDSVIRSDSRGFGVAGSFSQCVCFDCLVTAGPRSS
jgi:hypothetical protein